MAGQLTIDTLKASSGVLATQNGMTGIAKAWVTYNADAQTISSSFNVSSVTYNGTGDYTVNFATAMTNANYALAASAGGYLPSDAARVIGTHYTYPPTTTTCRVACSLGNGGANNRNNIGMVFFGS